MEKPGEQQSQLQVLDWRVLVLLLFATFFSISLMGFEFPSGNNSIHVPIVLDYAGSEEGPHDAFHRSLKDYYSGFWLLLSFITSENNIYEVFLTFHVLARFLNLLVLFLLVRTLAPEGDLLTAALGVSCLALFGIALGVTPIGFHGIFGGALSHSAFATTFFLLSWLFALRQQWILAAAMMGIAFNLNAFVGFWGAVVVGAARLWQDRPQISTGTIKSAAFMAGGFIAMALPTIFWIGASLMETPGADTTYDFRDFVLAHFPEHNFVHVQIHNLSKIFLLVVGIALLLAATWKSLLTSHRGALAAFFVTMIGIFLFGLLLPYVTSNRLLLLLYPLRIDGFLTFLLFICAVTAVSIAAQQSRKTSCMNSPHAMTALLSLSHGNLPLLVAAAAQATESVKMQRIAGAIFMVLGAYVAAFESSPLHWANAGTPLSVATTIEAAWIFVTLYCLMSPLLMRSDRHPTDLSILYSALALVGMASITHMEQAAAPLATLFFLVGIYLVLPPRSDVSRRLISVLAVLPVLGTWAYVTPSPSWALSGGIVALGAGLLLANWRDVIPQSTILVLRVPLVLGFIAVGVFAISQSIALGGLSKQSRLHHAWVEAQGWARANTAPDSLFLTPKYLNDFATLSRRPVWVDWKSGAAANWQPDYYLPWQDRMNEVRKLKSKNDWYAYAAKTNVDYIVFRLSALTAEERKSLDYVYRNRVFAIANVKG